MTSGKPRLDIALVERGFMDSREKARRAIMAGLVLVNGQVAAKAGTPTAADAQIALVAREKFVGRGGLKLEGGLEHFGIPVASRIALDVGASTGGFTDCLLQRGAERVYAVDVGHGQLDWKIRQDPRVVVHEGLNARVLDPALFVPRPSLVVADVSFISLTLILPAIFSLLESDADILVLIKPQFELSRADVARGGIVRDPVLHERAIEKIRTHVEDHGHAWIGSCASPITGRDGNIEFLAHVRP